MNIKNSKPKTKLFNSIKSKLVLLGSVAIGATIILGITGINLINSNNAQQQITNEINNINLLQHENQTNEISFLYHLDNEYYSTILNNQSVMLDYANKAISLKQAAYQQT